MIVCVCVCVIVCVCVCVCDSVSVSLCAESVSAKSVDILRTFLSIQGFYSCLSKHTHPYLHCMIIICTNTNTHTHTQYYSYWPGKGEQEAFGNILVTVEEETAEHYYTTRVVTVSNTKVVVLSPLLPGQTSGGFCCL